MLLDLTYHYSAFAVALHGNPILGALKTIDLELKGLVHLQWPFSKIFPMHSSILHTSPPLFK